MPRWTRGVLALAGVYVAVMLAAALWLPHEWDWCVFDWLSARMHPTFSQDVKLVDVAWDATTFPRNRRASPPFSTASWRATPANAVILDVEFDPCQSAPCGEPMASARTRWSRHPGERVAFPVYATEEPTVDRDDDDSGPLDPEDPNIYGVLSGAAQTRFTIIPHSTAFLPHLLRGRPVVDASGDRGHGNVWAMVVRVLVTRRFASSAALRHEPLAVRMGPAMPAGRRRIFRFTTAGRFRPRAVRRQDYLIVGTLALDRPPFTDRSGPELLGWAMSNALDHGSVVGRDSTTRSRRTRCSCCSFRPSRCSRSSCSSPSSSC